jgi:hypothetical protein
MEISNMSKQWCRSNGVERRLKRAISMFPDIARAFMASACLPMLR